MDDYSVSESNMDMSSMMSLMMGMNMGNGDGSTEERDPRRIYSNNIMSNMLKSLMEETKTNNLKDFKVFVEDEKNGIKALSTDITYGYSTQLNIYQSDTSRGVYQVNPSQVFNEIGMGGLMGTDNSDGASMMNSYASAGSTGINVWSELSDNEKILT